MAIYIYYYSSCHACHLQRWKHTAAYCLLQIFVLGELGFVSWYDARTERVLHDGGEIHGLLHVDGLSLRRWQPFQLPDEAPHEELDMVHAQRVPGAHPPAGAERHHLDLPAPGDVHAVPLAAVQKPLRPELARRRPH